MADNLSRDLVIYCNLCVPITMNAIRRMRDDLGENLGGQENMTTYYSTISI